MRQRFTVHGRVQGVGFRAWTVRQARTLGLRGTVRNRPNGSVEVEAEGPDTALQQLRQLLERGPMFADVTDLRELEPGPDSLPDPFEIKR